eukprot:491391-Rhodomonas_salina.1
MLSSFAGAGTVSVPDVTYSVQRQIPGSFPSRSARFATPTCGTRSRQQTAQASAVSQKKQGSSAEYQMEQLLRAVLCCPT